MRFIFYYIVLYGFCLLLLYNFFFMVLWCIRRLSGIIRIVVFFLLRIFCFFVFLCDDKESNVIYFNFEKDI